MNLLFKLNIQQNRNFLGIGTSIILLIGLIISPNIQLDAFADKYSSNACPAKNVQHWDKIVFVIKSADLAKRLKLPANSELDIKVLDDPTKVADLKKNVLNFLKVPNEPRSSIEILQVKYAMICVA